MVLCDDVKRLTEENQELQELVDQLSELAAMHFIQLLDMNWAHESHMQSALQPVLDRCWKVLSEEYFESFRKNVIEEEISIPECRIDLLKNLWQTTKDHNEKLIINEDDK